MMLSEDLWTLREQLAQSWRELSQLEVTEQAEALIRGQHEHLLLEKLGPKMSEVDRSSAHAENVLAEINGLRERARQAKASYLARRTNMQHRIHATQRAISRRQAEQDDGVLRSPSTL